MPVSDEIYCYLINELKIEIYRGVGCFYDKPKEATTENLRSEIGCVIETKDIELLNTSGCKYKIKTLSSSRAITTEFPFKGIGSILLGVIKIYPAL